MLVTREALLTGGTGNQRPLSSPKDPLATQSNPLRTRSITSPVSSLQAGIQSNPLHTRSTTSPADLLALISRMPLDALTVAVAPLSSSNVSAVPSRCRVELAARGGVRHTIAPSTPLAIVVSLPPPPESDQLGGTLMATASTSRLLHSACCALTATWHHPTRRGA